MPLRKERLFLLSWVAVQAQAWRQKWSRLRPGETRPAYSGSTSKQDLETENGCTSSKTQASLRPQTGRQAKCVADQKYLSPPARKARAKAARDIHPWRGNSTLTPFIARKGRGGVRLVFSARRDLALRLETGGQRLVSGLDRSRGGPFFRALDISLDLRCLCHDTERCRPFERRSP